MPSQTNSSRLTDPHLPYPGARDCPGRRHPGSTPLRRASPASSLANTSTIRPRARPTCPMADLPSPARPRPCSPRLASPQHPRASPPTCLGQPRPSLRRPRATCLPRPPIANPAPCDVPTLSVTALGDMPARPDTTRAPPPSQPDRPCQLHSAHRPAPPGLRPTCPSRSPPFGPARRAMPFRATSLPGPTDRFHAPRTYPARAHPTTRAPTHLSRQSLPARTPPRSSRLAIPIQATPVPTRRPSSPLLAHPHRVGTTCPSPPPRPGPTPPRPPRLPRPNTSRPARRQANTSQPPPLPAPRTPTVLSEPPRPWPRRPHQTVLAETDPRPDPSRTDSPFLSASSRPGPVPTSLPMPTRALPLPAPGRLTSPSRPFPDHHLPTSHPSPSLHRARPTSRVPTVPHPATPHQADRPRHNGPRLHKGLTTPIPSTPLRQSRPRPDHHAPDPTIHAWPLPSHTDRPRQHPPAQPFPPLHKGLPVSSQPDPPTTRRSTPDLHRPSPIRRLAIPCLPPAPRLA